MRLSFLALALLMIVAAALGWLLSSSCKQVQAMPSWRKSGSSGACCDLVRSNVTLLGRMLSSPLVLFPFLASVLVPKLDLSVHRFLRHHSPVSTTDDSVSLQFFNLKLLTSFAGMIFTLTGLPARIAVWATPRRCLVLAHSAALLCVLGMNASPSVVTLTIFFCGMAVALTLIDPATSMLHNHFLQEQPSRHRHAMIPAGQFMGWISVLQGVHKGCGEMWGAFLLYLSANPAAAATTAAALLLLGTICTFFLCAASPPRTASHLHSP